MKQTKFDNSLPIDYLSQASKVLKHYWQDEVKAKYVHYNFMARGEALANPNLLNNADSILYDLGKLATSFDPELSVKFNISTIMPKSLPMSLSKAFKIIHPTVYYSLYSTRDEFRKKWMPQAMPLDQALEMLKDYQVISKKTIKIHHCFIEGENDSEGDVIDMIFKLQEHGLTDNTEFNLVRYNPYSPVQGKESSEEVINRNMGIIEHHMKAKIIPRVGVDVFASCGTFPDAEKLKTFHS